MMELAIEDVIEHAGGTKIVREVVEALHRAADPN